MPKISYVAFNPNRKSVELVGKANEIIEDYKKDGYKLTLRQLFYQFVSRDIIPNTLKDYKNLGHLISKARLAGMIDWEAIEDRGRYLQGRIHRDSPGELVRDCAAAFHKDWWQDQPVKPEVWIEKDALAGVFERICTRYDVPFFSCRGYNSQSAMWESAMRIKGRKQGTKILHFGDHDPSGIDMTRDMRVRLETFGADVEFVRVALMRDQIAKYKPPPNPAKESDARYDKYVKKFGKKCWELDALDPKILSGLVESRVKAMIKNKAGWERRKRQEKEGQDLIQEVADSMDE